MRISLLGVSPMLAPFMVKTSPSNSTVSPASSLRSSVMYSRMVLSIRSASMPISRSAVGLAVPAVAATRPGANSSMVASAMAVTMGCRE